MVSLHQLGIIKGIAVVKESVSWRSVRGKKINVSIIKNSVST
jgi:hypothetical protein